MNDQTAKTCWTGRHLIAVERDGWEYATRRTARAAVGVVAVTQQRNVILVEQYRPPVAEKIFELPAGLVGDVADARDESFLLAAQRELLEETGYTAASWTPLCGGYSSPGLTDERVVLFLAQGLTKIAAGGGNEREAITIHEAPLDDVLAWLAGRNAQADFKLLAGLYATQRHLAEPAD